MAGCVEDELPDRSLEQLSISILDVGKESYIVQVPLWLSPSGSSVDTWMEILRVHSGQVTNLTLVETERGPAVRIVGNGTVTLGAADVPGPTPPKFIRGAMSLGYWDGNDDPMLFVEQGNVDVIFFYEGQSRDCYLPVTASWNSPGTGWKKSHTYSRQDPGFDCQ